MAPSQPQSLPTHHQAVVTVTPSGPLQIHQVPTPTPTSDEVLILNHFTASTPLDLHQATSHLLVNPPHILGDGISGTIMSVGPDVQHFKPGDQVFGYQWRYPKERAHQLFCCTNENLIAKIPQGFTMEEVVVVPNNFVAAWHTVMYDFGLDLPWPMMNKSSDDKSKEGWILIWGGASSVGMYALQVLKWYGYTNVIAVASEKHERKLKGYGAKVLFDYRDNEVAEKINRFIDGQALPLKYVLDCIGHRDGSVEPLSKIARSGSKVAVLLPVINRDAAEGVVPEYCMDVGAVAPWRKGVDTVGVRTHFYTKNTFLAENLQREIMPAALEIGMIEPNKKFIVEAPTLLERAEKAIRILRDKQISGARLVWRIAEKDEIEKYTYTASTHYQEQERQ